MQLMEICKPKIEKRQPFGSAQDKQAAALQEIPHPYLASIVAYEVYHVNK